MCSLGLARPASGVAAPMGTSPEISSNLSGPKPSKRAADQSVELLQQSMEPEAMHVQEVIPDAPPPTGLQMGWSKPFSLALCGCGGRSPCCPLEGCSRRVCAADAVLGAASNPAAQIFASGRTASSKTGGRARRHGATARALCELALRPWFHQSEP